jgi:diacylglycerol O-acyltransferase / wax synthase
MPPQGLNRRFSTQDASFLYVEKPTQPMHIGSVNVYDGHVSRDEVIAVLQQRLHLLPRYRQRAVFPPFGVAHPTWEDDPSFDAANHVEEIALPAPGDDRTLSSEGGRAYAKQLDRERPLWKLVLVQGHESGNTHMIAMVHHCMVDGISGVELQMALHDLTANAPPPAAPVAAWQPEPLPDPLTLLQNAVRDRLTETAQSFADESFRFFRPTQLAQLQEQLTAAMATTMPYLMRPAPRTPFNGPISGERSFSWVEVPFTEIRAMRNAVGGTVNDLVLTVLGGAFGRYLRLNNYPTENVELRAMCPVSMRAADGMGALGNQVSMMFAPLYAGILDPIERLTTVRRAMERLKDQGQAQGLYALTNLGSRVPPAMQAMTGLMDAPQTLLNTVSTNVPGPQIPLYLHGHKQLHWYPLGICSANIGLFVAILTYNQQLTFGATVDARQVPDPWAFAACVREAYDELKAAASAIDATAAGPAAPPPQPAAATA